MLTDNVADDATQLKPRRCLVVTLPEILTAAITPSARGAAAAQKCRNGKTLPFWLNKGHVILIEWLPPN